MIFVAGQGYEIKRYTKRTSPANPLLLKVTNGDPMGWNIVNMPTSSREFKVVLREEVVLKPPGTLPFGPVNGGKIASEHSIKQTHCLKPGLG